MSIHTLEGSHSPNVDWDDAAATELGTMFDEEVKVSTPEASSVKPAFDAGLSKNIGSVAVLPFLGES